MFLPVNVKYAVSMLLVGLLVLVAFVIMSFRLQTYVVEQQVQDAIASTAQTLNFSIAIQLENEADTSKLKSYLNQFVALDTASGLDWIAILNEQGEVVTSTPGYVPELAHSTPLSIAEQLATKSTITIKNPMLIGLDGVGSLVLVFETAPLLDDYSSRFAVYFWVYAAIIIFLLAISMLAVTSIYVRDTQQISELTRQAQFFANGNYQHEFLDPKHARPELRPLVGALTDLRLQVLQTVSDLRKEKQVSNQLNRDLSQVLLQSKQAASRLAEEHTFNQLMNTLEYLFTCSHQAHTKGASRQRFLDLLSRYRHGGASVNTAASAGSLRNHFRRISSSVIDHNPQAIEVAVSIECDEAIDWPYSVNSLDIVINEWLDNALVHAFESHHQQPKLRLQALIYEQQLHILYQDNGCGITDELLPHVFWPFYTGKPEAHAGLGLFELYLIVKHQWNGQLDVESKHGAYTRFHITVDLTPRNKPDDLSSLWLGEFI